jgi:uncharacterized protein (UPF0335 family)
MANKKTGNASHDKVVEQMEKANLRTGKVNSQLKEIFAKYMDLEEETKVLNQAKRELRAQAKDQFQVPSSVFSHEIRLKKMDKDVRQQFEAEHHDLKLMLGIQLSLDVISNDKPKDVKKKDPAQAAAKAAAAN